MYDSIIIPIKLGIAIKPLNISDSSHTDLPFNTQPSNVHTIKDILYTTPPLLPNRYLLQVSPQNDQPINVANANKDIAIVINIPEKIPKPHSKDFIIKVVLSKLEKSTLVSNIASAVMVQHTIVSIKTSNIPQSPIVCGLLLSDDECNMDELPRPASLENTPLRSPTFKDVTIMLPVKPPVTELIPKA